MDGLEELTDEQMLILLQSAETRLKLKEREAGSHDRTKPFNFPKLSTGEIAKSHVQPGQHGSVQLVKRKKDSSTSRAMRKVEDPVLVRKKTTEVSARPLSSLSMRKSYPNFPDADSWHRLGCYPAHNEALFS